MRARIRSSDGGLVGAQREVNDALMSDVQPLSIKPIARLSDRAVTVGTLPTLTGNSIYSQGSRAPATAFQRDENCLQVSIGEELRSCYAKC